MEKTLFSKDYQAMLDVPRSQREHAGVTQDELAKLLGTGQSVISKCERGEGRLGVIEHRRWCLAFGVSLQTFLAKLEMDLEGGPALQKRKRS